MDREPSRFAAIRYATGRLKRIRRLCWHSLVLRTGTVRGPFIAAWRGRVECESVMREGRFGGLTGVALGLTTLEGAGGFSELRSKPQIFF